MVRRALSYHATARRNQRAMKRTVVALGIRANGWWIIKCPGRTLLIPCGEKWPNEKP